MNRTRVDARDIKQGERIIWHHAGAAHVREVLATRQGTFRVDGVPYVGTTLTFKGLEPADTIMLSICTGGLVYRVELLPANPSPS